MSKIKISQKHLDNIKPVTINKPERILNMGITQLKEAVLSVCQFISAGKEALEDGKITLSDIPLFITPLIGLPSAISGIEQVPAELADLDEAEKNELVAYIQDKLNLGEKTEAIVGKAISVLYEMKSLYDLIKG